MKAGIRLQAAILMSLAVATSGCREQAAPAQKPAAKHKLSLFHHRNKQQWPKPSPTAHLIVLRRL